MMIFPMCSDFSSATRFQVLPASVDLYRPSPKWALRWLVFSPVPSHTTLESFGSTTTQQSVNEPPSSKMGANVTPRFSVFQRPPNALATYQTFGFFGSISMSCTRPVDRPGPMLLISMPLSASAVRPPPLWPETAAVTAAASAAATSHIRLVIRVSAKSGPAAPVPNESAV